MNYGVSCLLRGGVLVPGCLSGWRAAPLSLCFIVASSRSRWAAVYVTVESFVDIGYIVGIECVFGRARWLKTKRTGLLSRARPIF